MEPDAATKDPEVPLTPGANSSLLEAIEMTTSGNISLCLSHSFTHSHSLSLSLSLSHRFEASAGT